MKKPAFFRALFLLLCIGVLAFSLLYERYDVHGLVSPSRKTLKGGDFIEVATNDGVIRSGGKFYDIYSIAGISVKKDQDGNITVLSATSSESTQTKDCKT
ncbi:MAG: hypothetical protein RDV48_21555 [Candidatus Eremiobacteraeota bacterium]|nr:hypothetical protein [Candidatus Eremiobacteraeota bacterium]